MSEIWHPRLADERGRQNIIQRQNTYLDLAREVFNDSHFTFDDSSYYGRIWNRFMDCLLDRRPLNDESDRSLTRIVFKADIVFESVRNIKGTLAYFERERNAWHEKVRQLFLVQDEEEFDSLCYEFYIGSNMSQEGKTIFFGNMEECQRSESESLCEYFVEPRLFIECKNLFGTGNHAIANNIRRANQQIRSTMMQIVVENPIGCIFLDLAERININNRDELVRRIAEVLNRLRQCDSTHFLGLTFMNIVTGDEVSTAYPFGKLLMNPAFKDKLTGDQDTLNLFRPRFRNAFIPDDTCQRFSILDFQERRILLAQNLISIFSDIA